MSRTDNLSPEPWSCIRAQMFQYAKQSSEPGGTN